MLANSLKNTIPAHASEDSQLTWEQVRSLLDDQKAQINQAIREYPLPITACDDQFNYLLEKRSKITQELGRFNRLYDGYASVAKGTKELEDFIEASDFIGS